MAERKTSSSVALAFVGSVMSPDEYMVEAYSQAGMAFQERFLAAVSHGLEVDRIYSIRSRSFYPAGPLFPGGGQGSVLGAKVRYLPFINHPLTQAPSLTVQIAPSLMLWGAGMERQGRPHAVVLYNFYPIPGIASLLGGKLGKSPVIGIAADVHVPGETRPDDFLHRLDHRLQTSTISRLSGIISLTREITAAFAPGVPSMILDGAIPDDRLLQIPIETLARRRASDPFIIIYSGQLSILKGIPLLLQAFSLLPAPHYQLWITGRGELEREVAAAAARDARITFFGYRPYEEVLGLYERATIFVNPHSTQSRASRYMFPSKLIEYLAAGRPVISTPGAGVEGEYDEYVEILPDDKPESLARAITRLAESSGEALATRARNGRLFVEREKSWHHQGMRAAEFIQRIATTSQGCRKKPSQQDP
jgi:glycosyltransferase involved in cell wall biosynthesis